MPNDVPWIFPKLNGSTMRKTPREPCWVFAQSPNGDHWVLVQVHKHVGASQVTKKSRGKQLGKAKLSSDTETKKAHGKIRKVVGQWSINGPCSPIFQSYVKKCHKYWNSMGDWRLWNGVSTVLLCEKTYPFKANLNFRGPCSPSKLMLERTEMGMKKGQYATFNTLNTPSSTPTCECILHRLWCVIPPCSTRTSCSWLHIPWDPTISNDIRQNRW